MQGVSTLPLGSYHGVPEDFHLLLQESRVMKGINHGFIWWTGADPI
jgi:hypothetical protein